MELFISGFLLSLSLCLDLGIVNIAIIKTGIEKSFVNSLNIGLGSTLGDILYAVISLLGINIILKFQIVKSILWIAGTLILLYFCYKMIIETFKPLVLANEKISKVSKIDNNLNFFLTGFGLSLASPTAILWFASIGGSVIANQNFGGYNDIIFFLGGFTASSLVWSLFLAYISFKGGQLMKNRIKKIFSVLSAIIFLILAVYVFINGYNTLNASQHPEHSKIMINNSNSVNINPDIQQINKLNDEENTEGWVLLFDGETGKSWRGYNLDTFPGNGWKIEDGTIHCLYQNHVNKEQQPDIITVQQYKDFELSVEWMLSDGASSAIYILVQENEDIPVWKSAISFRIADYIGNTDFKPDRQVYNNALSLNNLLPFSTHINGLKGRWNQTRIILNKDKVSMIVNGEKLLDFQLWTEDWERIVNKSKYKGLSNLLNPGGPDKKGYIGLQNNGSEVWFRNIKIRVIE